MEPLCNVQLPKAMYIEDITEKQLPKAMYIEDIAEAFTKTRFANELPGAQNDGGLQQHRYPLKPGPLFSKSNKCPLTGSSQLADVANEVPPPPAYSAPGHVESIRPPPGLEGMSAAETSSNGSSAYDPIQEILEGLSARKDCRSQWAQAPPFVPPSNQSVALPAGAAYYASMVDPIYTPQKMVEHGMSLPMEPNAYQKPKEDTQSKALKSKLKYQEMGLEVLKNLAQTNLLDDCKNPKQKMMDGFSSKQKQGKTARGPPAPKASKQTPAPVMPPWAESMMKRNQLPLPR